jgi:shikimate dehydrogenase
MTTTVKFSGDKDTVLVISVAARPSVFGYTLYNTAFQHMSINMIYKPFPASSEQQLANIIAGVRGLGIIGCSVSMPYKETVMKYLDVIDNQAKLIGAVNTIVNKNNVLTGFNTDYEGTKTILKPYTGKSLLILGTGGVAKAVILAGKESGMKVIITGRTDESVQALTKNFDITSIPWNDRNTYKADVLINCTSVGMEPTPDELVLDHNALSNFQVIGDLVMKPPKSILIREAEKRQIPSISGPTFMLNQFLHQFKLYTGKDAPADIASSIIQTIV